MRCNGCRIIIGVVLNLSGCCCGVGDILDRVACKSAHILLRLTVALIHLIEALVNGGSALLDLLAKLHDLDSSLISIHKFHLIAGRDE